MFIHSGLERNRRLYRAGRYSGCVGDAEWPAGKEVLMAIEEMPIVSDLFRRRPGQTFDHMASRKPHLKIHTANDSHLMN